MKAYLILLFFGMLSIQVMSQTDSVVQSTPDESAVEQVAEKINNLSKQVVGLPNDVKKVTTEESPSISNLISISKIFWAVVLILIGYFTIKFTSQILEVLAEKSTQYRITIKSFIPIIKILGWLIIVFLVIAGVFRPPLHTLLAFSASIGVAVGFASQDILKNIFGGIIILFDRPFKSGDKIQIGSYYGEVVEIGLRSTRIVTPDDNLVSIPNSEIMNSPVSNANAGESNCQVVSEIFLPINADTSKARAIATEVAKVSKYVYLNKPVTIIFINDYKDKDPILKMKVKAYVLDIRDEFKFKSEVTELVIKKLIEEQMIIPTQNISN